MKWSYEELDRRCAKNTLFKNNACRLAKNIFPEHKDIQMGYPKIYNPEGITNEEELTFAIKLGYKVKYTAKRHSSKLTSKTGTLPKLSNPSLLGFGFIIKPLQ